MGPSPALNTNARHAYSDAHATSISSSGILPSAFVVGIGVMLRSSSNGPCEYASIACLGGQPPDARNGRRSGQYSEAPLIFPCGAVSLTSMIVWLKPNRRALVEASALEWMLF